MDYENYLEEVKDFSKEVCIITNGNGKGGYELAKYLTSKGATVVLGVEHYSKGRNLADQINELNPFGTCISFECKLNSLRDVRMFAKDIQEHFSNISLLVHNVNIKDSNSYQTVDGFETYFGVNYLSLFTLTGLLSNKLFSTNSRIITAVPFIKLPEKIEFSQFRNPKNKKEKELYIQSIVASMFFSKKLDEHLRQNNKLSSSILCYMEDEEKWSKKEKYEEQKLPQELFPIIYSLTSDLVKSGDEIGYKKNLRHVEDVTDFSIIKDKYNSILADNLWKISEELVDVYYNFQ